MPTRTIKPLLAAAIAYPFATWLLAGGLIVRSMISGGSLDGSVVLMLVAAPIAVPVLMLYGIGNWMGGLHRQNEVPWCCLALGLAWVVCYVGVRRITRTRRAN